MPDEAIDTKRVKRDKDGDYIFWWKKAACWVQVEEISDPAVRVMSHAAHGLKSSAKLLREINDLNGATRLARISLSSGTVVVEYEMPWEAAEPKVLRRACPIVANVSAEVGPMLATVFGGQTPFENRCVHLKEEAA